MCHSNDSIFSGCCNQTSPERGHCLLMIWIIPPDGKPYHFCNIPNMAKPLHNFYPGLQNN